ncbi:DEAD/DEAH box helicase [Shouchella shacheensis]|uniref:DEAD/DEAH box helicase n=1 Tax=Shouchella shacheensis TaxID=1649580 RepID=UPI00073FB4A2|nr:DEAD/DEAH box helicase [Shouchella shacheensis]
MIEQFTAGMWPERVATVLAQQGITEPTPIQTKMIPEALDGQNILARSQTGTGKTLAYLMPILAKINPNKSGIQSVILAPSQELAMQIADLTKALTEGTGILSAPFIGGANVNRQVEKLKKQKPHIAIGTPGRVLELVMMKKLKLSEVEVLAVDEVDRLVSEEKAWEAMLELGKRTGRKAQFFFVSATVPNGLEEQLGMFAPFLTRIEAEGGMLPEAVRHLVLWVEGRERMDVTRKLIHAEEIEKGIVFVNQLEKVTETVEKLNYRKIETASLSSENNKHEREKALQAFRTGAVRILVATDVASRGLDIEGVTHIIQLDAPNVSDSYLHRAGRTGRMNKEGKVITLLEERESYKKKKYETMLGIELENAYIQGGGLHLGLAKGRGKR